MRVRVRVRVRFCSSRAESLRRGAWNSTLTTSSGASPSAERYAVYGVVRSCPNSALYEPGFPGAPGLRPTLSRCSCPWNLASHVCTGSFFSSAMK